MVKKCCLIGLLALSFGSVQGASDEERFVRAAIAKIHSSLRLAVFMSDYHLACLTDDEQWFAQNTVRPFLYRQKSCSFRMDALKEEIRQKYPLMISLLIIYHYRDIFRMPKRMENGLEKEIRASHAQQRDMVRHLFPGLVELPPATMDQLKAATEVLQQEQFCQGVDLECYEKEYKALLVGKEESVPGLPILGFVTSARPEKGELIRAIRKIRENTRDLLEEFRHKYFVVENGEYHLKVSVPKKYARNSRIYAPQERFSIDNNLDLFEFSGILKNSLSRESEEFQGLFERGFARWESREEDQMWTEMGALLVWIGGCMAFFRTPTALQWCILPTGIGANLYFFAMDTKRYQKAIDIALYRADNDAPSTYQDISRLDDLAFARTLSIVMLPFFTEIPRLFKYTSHLRRQKKILEGAVDEKPYKIWDVNKSSTTYKVLLDHTLDHPHFLRMGAAIIDDELLRHQHKEGEIYYFLKGKGVTRLGKPGEEIEIPVQKGMVLYIPSGVPHYTKANAGDPLELLYVFPRYDVKDIDYVFDGTLESFERSIQVGDVSEIPGFVQGVHRETVIAGKERELLFNRLAIVAGKKISQKAESNTILFVHEGRGVITVGTQRVTVEKGRYLLIPEGHQYTVESGASQGLDLFLFEKVAGQ